MPHTFLPSLFAPDEEDLILETSRTIPLLATYVFADGVQTALNGVIRGCGRQIIIVPIVVVSYWVIAVPLAYYLAFIVHGGEMECDEGYFCGDVGLVGGYVYAMQYPVLVVLRVIRPLMVCVLCISD
jgi:Na+-driven multidrug efflux pump